MKKAIAAVMMTVLLAGGADAATPKAESVVTRDRITLGDVFDGVTANHDYYLAPAPAVGKTTVLNAHDLTRISNAFSLGWRPEDGPSQVVVRRVARETSAVSVEPAVKQALAEKMNGQKFEIELYERTAAFTVPEKADKTLTVEDVSYDAAQGTFSAVVSVRALPGAPKEVKGRLYPLVSVPVLKTTHQPGDIISKDDIDMIDLRQANVLPSMLMDADKLAGRTPRRGLLAMKPVSAGDVQAPRLIKKGDLVTMELDTGVIRLTAKGKAMDDGAEGEAVRIMNTNSKQIIDAIVTGAQTVAVRM